MVNKNKVNSFSSNIEFNHLLWYIVMAVMGVRSVFLFEEKGENDLARRK